MIREIKDIIIRKIDNENKIKEILAAKTLSDLGLNFEDAVQILAENNVPLILGEEDKAITARDAEFNSLEDFVLIHVTRFPPTQSKIKSPREANGILSDDIKLNEKKYDFEIPNMRDTVHFTVNNEVNTDHGYLNCDDCRYAVLIPMSDVIREQEMKGEAADIYTVEGGPKISVNSYILCPKGEGEKLRASNPGVNIIEYEGESVRGYAKAFLSTLGYIQCETGAHSFLRR